MIIYVDDITGKQYAPKDWESQVSYTLTVSQDGQVIDQIDTVTPNLLVRYLSPPKVDMDEEVPVEEAVIQTSLRPVEESQESEQIIQETLDDDAVWMSEEQLREWERANRSNSHGIEGLRVDNREV